MPRSKSKTARAKSVRKSRRHAQPIKGKSGRVTRKRKPPVRSRPRSLPKNLSKPKKKGLRRVKPIAQRGPGADTIWKSLGHARKHAKAGRNSKAALYYTLAAAQAASFLPQHPNVVDRRMMEHDYTSGPVADARGQVDWHLAYPKSHASHYTRRKGSQRRKQGQKTGKKKGRNRRRANKNRKSRGHHLPPPPPIQARLYGIPVRVPRRHTYEFRSN